MRKINRVSSFKLLMLRSRFAQVRDLRDHRIQPTRAYFGRCPHRQGQEDYPRKEAGPFASLDDLH